MLWQDSYGFYIYSIYILISYRIFSIIFQEENRDSLLWPWIFMDSMNILYIYLFSTVFFPWFFRKRVVTFFVTLDSIYILYTYLFSTVFFPWFFRKRVVTFLWLWIFLDSNSVNPGIPSLLFAEFCTYLIKWQSQYRYVQDWDHWVV